MLGASGLGKHQAHFAIVALKNQYRQDILIHNSIDMRNYAISTVGAYVDYRMKMQGKSYTEQEAYGQMCF